ncbi:hypothetical protein Hdeb2414_s0008g00278541 [Helianthus debilis subsp. tardiflorus]
MGRDDFHQWGYLSPTEPPSLYTQDQRDDHWRHFDKSVNAISFGFVATAILISMFLVMAIFERFLRTTSPVLSPGGGGGRNAAGNVDTQMGFSSKVQHSSLKIVKFASLGIFLEFMCAFWYMELFTRIYVCILVHGVI